MGVAFDNFHRQNDFYMIKYKQCIMDQEDDNEFEEHFDTESDDEDVGGESITTHTEPAHPDVITIAQLIEDALNPLIESIETMTEAYTEEPQGYTRLSELINERSKSLHQEINKSLKEPTSDPDQPCNGQILPASVRDEIDRLYKIEKAHKISERAERALNHILDNDPILIKLPDNLDDRLLLMSVLNGWYTQAYPDRAPLKLSPGGH